MITRQQVEAAIDFYILLEHSQHSYSSMLAKNATAITMHKANVRQFGEEISPKTLAHMQDVYYSFTNSEKYRANSISISVAGTVLSSNWHGIGDWLD